MNSQRSLPAFRRLLAKLLLAGLAFGAHDLVHAEGPEPEQSISFNVGAVSDYRVRGIAQTSFKPAIQGGIDFADKSGFYLGTWASNVRWVKALNGATKGSVEVDVYGGYRGALDVLPLTYDAGLITYQYPGNNSGTGGVLPAGTFGNADTVEAYISGTWKMFTLKYNRSLSNFMGNLHSHGSQYFDLSAAIDLTNGFLLVPHVGHQSIPGQAGDLGDYTDWSLTLSKDFGNGLAATLAATGTDAKRIFYTDTNGRFLGKNAVEVGVKYSF
ncbi:MAG: TorF family putative porin [Vitreoscilla sp.]